MLTIVMKMMKPARKVELADKSALASQHKLTGIQTRKNDDDTYTKTHNMTLSLSSWNGNCGRMQWNLGFLKICHCHKMRPTHARPERIRTQIVVALFQEYSLTAAWFRMKTGNTVPSIISTMPRKSRCLNWTLAKFRKVLGHKKNNETIGTNANGPLRRIDQYKMTQSMHVAVYLIQNAYLQFA